MSEPDNQVEVLDCHNNGDPRERDDAVGGNYVLEGLGAYPQYLLRAYKEDTEIRSENLRQLYVDRTAQVKVRYSFATRAASLALAYGMLASD